MGDLGTDSVNSARCEQYLEACIEFFEDPEDGDRDAIFAIIVKCYFHEYTPSMGRDDFNDATKRWGKLRDFFEQLEARDRTAWASLLGFCCAKGRPRQWEPLKRLSPFKDNKLEFCLERGVSRMTVSTIPVLLESITIPDLT
ncbi:MAG: hypothetical protein WC641_04265 [Patescibacteria group bacterium]